MTKLKVKVKRHLMFDANGGFAQVTIYDQETNECVYDLAWGVSTSEPDYVSTDTHDDVLEIPE